MSRRRFHGLKRIKFRMTWNKYNLYNLSQMKAPNPGSRNTYFQQKWAAKSATRAYHGEQIREKPWERMFSSRLNAVIPMDHTYLAEHDGSEHAAGRGSGVDKILKTGGRKKSPTHIPYMSMTYAPIERRLDIAIFRALFASSARQARQFVTHGSVKVNGKKMSYPGYLLNPGDMFQVDPERVLFATGQAKTRAQAKRGREIKRTRRIINSTRSAKKSTKKEKSSKAAAVKTEAAESAAEDSDAKLQPRKTSKALVDDADIRKHRKADFQELLKQIQGVLANNKTPPSAKKKQDLRSLNRDIKVNMSQINRMPISELESNLTELVSRLFDIAPKPVLTIRKRRLPEPDVGSRGSHSLQIDRKPTAEEQKLTVQQALVEHRESLIDDSKPYATPWTPRPFMSAFAFIPRYLEVNHNICSAVYLRHPVARPGRAEIPTPFSPEQMQLAFNWYLRRR